MVVQDWLGKDNIVGIDIWEKKYRQNNETFEEWLDRVSNHNQEVRNLIIQKKFLFGGRILSNRDIPSKVTYSNCYVLTPPEDSIESIFECASKMARTFSYGGGVGVDISKLAQEVQKFITLQSKHLVQFHLWICILTLQGLLGRMAEGVL